MIRLSMFLSSAPFLVLCILFTTVVAAQDSTEPAREFYELRIYKTYDFEKQKTIEKYIEFALMPALKRQSLDRIGVFTRTDDENDHSIYMLIPFAKMDSFTNLNSNLAKDAEYQKAAQGYFDRKLNDPVFTRIESRFMKAFQAMPKMELPTQTVKGGPRIFELRLYESHTEKHAALKVDMFNSGETQLMRDVKMGPVFFGETLIGPDVPNLVYMLSASDLETHQQHWQAFLKSDEWNRIKKLEKYKDTVSNIKKWFLKPTSYSQL